MAPEIIENVVKAYLGNDDSPDISNPIHSTEVAKAYGFDGPLVGGVTVWGWATETILEALGNSWLSNGWAEYSFRQPTFPGDILKVRATRDPDSPWESWTVDMVNQADVVSVTGKIGLGAAPWSSDFVRPVNMEPSALNHKGNLSLETVETGLDWCAMQGEFTEEVLTEFTTTKQLTNNPLFVGGPTNDDPIAHPSWTAGWAEQLMRHNFDVPSSMHTRSRIQHHAVIPSGTNVIGGAHIVEAYERKAHHFVHFDVLLQDSLARDIAQLSHWTIFKIATSEERANVS